MDAITAQYEDLTNKMEQNLPIKALPTRELVAQLRGEFPKLTLKTQFIISKVMNTGDISGILCVIKYEDTRLACALTHLDFPKSEPLKKEIEKYQTKRAIRVELQDRAAKLFFERNH